MFVRTSLLTSITAAIVLVSAETAPTTPPYQGAILLQAGNNAGKCLRADNKNGAPVELVTCTGGDDQEWLWDGGLVTLYNGAKCLEVVDGNTANGAKLQVWDCSGDCEDENQEFEYTPWGENHIKWTKGGKCMDLPNGSMHDGNQVQLWDCNSNNPNQNWDTGYMYNKLPKQSEHGQIGTNRCGTESSQSSMCQTMWMNDADDFCLWAPSSPGGSIGETERQEVAYCTKSGRGTRVIPDGTLGGVHFVQTPDYVQVTGTGDFTKINVKKGDYGGELDPHGADGNGNPVGALVFGDSFGKHLQYHEWTSFISDGQFCMRACTGPNAKQNCQHIYDEQGCQWNMPANYEPGKFESCKGDNDLPMGIYGGSVWHQGDGTAPAPHPVASSSECKSYPTISSSHVKRDLSLERMVKRAADPLITPAPPMF